MGTYVVTGAASGIGRASADRLRADGHRVIGVDLRDTDVTADLSTDDGRRAAIDAVIAEAGVRLDGAVMAAGLGPAKGRERLIVDVNVLGVTELLDGLRPALAASGNAKVVVLGSNSTTTTPMVPRRAVRRLVDGDLDGAVRQIRRRAGISGPVAYAASKIAVTRWCRIRAVTDDWAGAGIRLNVLAPGPVLTPLLQAQLESSTGSQVRSFPMPIREFGTPGQLAEWITMLLSPAANSTVGSVIVVDGGTDALIRPRDWPRSLPIRAVPRLLWAMYRAPREGRVAQY
ncbi:SDR family oxidoreductase [Gordonia insulae]|uniref:3-alpha-hydroxysteroid dehydrogenase/carbonyl reductase n=1 Tax=Gordonia insulae TaxID=2420509 RepID=A0A3G8JT31_9ACTN|nr:SDR family oxidoreductase [Gordonia insulae]AZG47729.1 3-alpha-hydroxysteroid dehydrogenase/carbonyl reductase [Gordonia insulae]